jgi:O-antigen biosynthesis protein WbqV
MRPGERLNEILFASEEPTVEIGIAGIMAAKPNQPPMLMLGKWLAELKLAVAKHDYASISGTLTDAVPEFGLGKCAAEAEPSG